MIVYFKYIKRNINKDTTVTMLFLFITVIWPKKNIFKNEDYEPLISWEGII
jgi:hypothetical protein